MTAPPTSENNSVDLSVVVPAYNEEKPLPQTLARIAAYLRQRPGSSELILVNDGSTDSTVAIAESHRASFQRLTIVTTGPSNCGKGCAVKVGMLAAQGRLALFTDADLSAPIEEADKLLAHLEQYDVAIGSRSVDRKLIEIHQPRVRELAGIMFNWVVRGVAGLPFVDTQCGFKAFRLQSCRPVFEKQRVMGFGFDPEILFLAKYYGLLIVEVPVRWSHDRNSKVRVLRDGLRMVMDLFLIRWNQLRGRYKSI